MPYCRSRSRLTSVIGHFALQHQDRFRVHSRLLTNIQATDASLPHEISQKDSHPEQPDRLSIWGRGIVLQVSSQNTLP